MFPKFPGSVIYPTIILTQSDISLNIYALDQSDCVIAGDFISEVRNVTKSQNIRLDIIKHLLDEAMSNMKIYSVETRNIRRGEAELDILGETE